MAWRCSGESLDQTDIVPSSALSPWVFDKLEETGDHSVCSEQTLL
jgi:hypothetical protein